MTKIINHQSAGFSDDDYGTQPTPNPDATPEEQLVLDRIEQRRKNKAARMHPAYTMPLEELREVAFHGSRKAELAEMQRQAFTNQAAYIASHPELPTGPDIQAAFVSWIEQRNATEISIPMVEKFYNELLAKKQIVPDYSQAAKDRRHKEVESWRANGMNLPPEIEMDHRTMPLESLQKVRGLAAPVSVPALKALHKRVLDVEEKYGEKTTPPPRPQPRRRRMFGLSTPGILKK